MPARKYDGDKAARKRAAAATWMAKNPKRAKNLYNEANRARKAKDPVKVFFTNLQARALRQRGHFGLSLEQVRQLMAPMVCSQTGHELSWEWHGVGPNPWAPSVDRIDSSIGYEMGNIQVVSWIYNRCKGEWPDDVVRQFRGAGPVPVQD